MINFSTHILQTNFLQIDLYYICNILIVIKAGPL